MKNFKEISDNYKTNGLTKEILNDLAQVYKTTSDYILDTFITLEVYNVYAREFRLHDYKVKNLTKGEVPTYLMVQECNYIGSSLFKEILDLVITFKTAEVNPDVTKAKINPVHYLSAIFSRVEYRARNKKSVMKLPTVDELQDTSIYTVTKDYYSRAYHEENFNSHSGIKYSTNKIIYYANIYFKLKAQNESIQQYLQDSYSLKTAQLATLALTPLPIKNSRLLDNLLNHYIASNGANLLYLVLYGFQDITTSILDFDLADTYKLTCPQDYILYLGYQFMLNNFGDSSSDVLYTNSNVDYTNNLLAYISNNQTAIQQNLLIRRYIRLKGYQSETITKGKIEEALSNPVDSFRLKETDLDHSYFRDIEEK